MAISTLTATMSTNLKWTAQNNLTGSVYSPVTNGGSILKSQAVGTAVANALSGGGDEIFSFQQGISAGSSATIDLNAMTNILQQASQAIVRIKGYQIRLLSAADDATISPAPNANSKVTVTNQNVAVPNPLDFATGGSGLTIDVTASAGALSAVAIGAAGTGYLPSSILLVNVNQASGTGGAIAVTVNSSGVPTAVALTDNVGSGYVTATGVATTVLGQYTILTGGAHMYFDPAAGGFAAVSATSKNIKIVNNDASNAVTVEIDVLGATS